MRNQIQRFLGLLILVIFSSVPGYSQDQLKVRSLKAGLYGMVSEEEALVKKSAFNPAQLLLDKGIFTYAGLNLVNLKKEFDTVQVRFQTFGDIQSIEGRTDSLYFIKGKVIVFNLNSIDRLNRSEVNGGISSLLFHEFLGALGYRDENYQFTSVIIAKALNANQTLGKSSEIYLGTLSRDRRITSIRPGELQGDLVRGNSLGKLNTKGRGTITGVGGGGSSSEIVLKANLISSGADFLSGKKPLSPQFEDFFFSQLIKMNLDGHTYKSLSDPVFAEGEWETDHGDSRLHIKYNSAVLSSEKYRYAVMLDVYEKVYTLLIKKVRSP